MRVIPVMCVVLLAGVCSSTFAQDAPAAASAAYQRMLEQARASEARGDLTAALATLVRLDRADVPPALRAEAMERIVTIENRLRAVPTGAMNRFATAYVFPIPSHVFWPGAFLIVGVLWALSARALPRKDRTSVSFEDLSQPRAERAEKNRILTRLFVSLLQNPAPVSMSSLRMDIIPGIDQPGFGGLQTQVDLAANVFAVDDYGYESSDRPIRIASLEFSLRDALTMFGRMFTRPPAGQLNGWLSESGDGVVAFARLTARGKLARSASWKVHRAGPDARTQAIADLAAQIFVESGKSTLTHSWRSFRSFHEALKLRQDADGMSGDLAVARDHLEQAVVHDPSNWIARFNLALTLCRDDQSRTALKHFEILEQVIERAWRANSHPEEECSRQPAFQDVVHHLKAYPECAFLILYNKAVSLAGLDDGAAKVEALQILNRIARLRDVDVHGDCGFDSPYQEIARTLSRQSKIELSLYALSAQAHLIAGGAGFGRSWPRVTDADARRVDALLAQIEDLCTSEQEQHWRSLQTARAVALVSSARLVSSPEQTELARDRLEAALAAEPRFVEAHLLLAELYIERTFACATDWARRAESLLKRVQQLSPASDRAAMLLARLCSSPGCRQAGRGGGCPLNAAQLKPEESATE